MTRFPTAVLALPLAALLQTRDCARTQATAPTPVAPAPTAIPSPPPPPVPTEAPDLWLSAVRPALKEHCAPCHEPGGKMYARLPFDDPKVPSSHSAGVLRRLKGEDKEAFERWLATLKPEEAKPKS
jgi:hypothetical protein